MQIQMLNHEWTDICVACIMLCLYKWTINTIKVLTSAVVGGFLPSFYILSIVLIVLSSLSVLKLTFLVMAAHVIKTYL